MTHSWYSQFIVMSVVAQKNQQQLQLLGQFMDKEAILLGTQVQAGIPRLRHGKNDTCTRHSMLLHRVGSPYP